MFCALGVLLACGHAAEPTTPSAARHAAAATPPREAAEQHGYLSEEQILAVVKRNQAGIKYCFDQEYGTQPNAKGRMIVTWRIDLEGHVTAVHVEQSTLPNRVEECALRQIERWQFPQPDGGSVVVTFPFIMRGG